MSQLCVSEPVSTPSKSETAPASPAQNYYHIPEELLEIVFTHFFRTTKTNLKNRAAILRTCSTWRRIAEPILWKHIAIDGKESGDRGQSKLEALWAVLKEHRGYGARVKLLTLSHVKWSTMDASGMQTFTQLISLKLLFNSISQWDRYMLPTDRGISDVLDKMSKTLSAFYFGVDLYRSEDHIRDSILCYPREHREDALDGLAYVLRNMINYPRMRFVRFELPPYLLHSLVRYSLQSDSLESFALYWIDTFKDLRWFDEWPGWLDYISLLRAIKSNSVPNLKQALILQSDE